MKIKHLTAVSFLFLALSNYATAEPIAPTLQTARDQVIKQYILDLQKADYRDIGGLFDKNGMVMSTSRGNANAKDFFYSFLPNVQSAATELHQTFTNNIDSNRYAARFHLTFTLKDGEVGNGEYVDEFIFMDNSAMLSAVYMFENLKFDTEKFK